jgi:hypothetical protein
MPALFAYLIALGILLGGGYGALNWLAAPEPVKVAAKAKPKSSSDDHASPQVTATQASPPAPKDSDQAAANSNDRPSSLQSEARVASEPGAQPQTPVAEDQKNRSANAGAPTDETRQHAEALPEEKQEASQPPEAAPPVSASDQSAVSATTVTAAPAPAAKRARRLHLRQASSRSEMGRERRALAVMTLRTIEFPDGRRVNVLVPYRGPERALAFQPDE